MKGGRASRRRPVFPLRPTSGTALTNPRYKVRFTKDHLVFCSGHFISYESDRCERPHGHNHRATVEVEGVMESRGESNPGPTTFRRGKKAQHAGKGRAGVPR